MDLPFDLFCDVVKTLDKSNAEKAIAILWFLDHETPDIAKTAGQLTKLLGDHHIGTPNQTSLAESIRKTKFANGSKSGFALKPGSRKIIRTWLPDLEESSLLSIMLRAISPNPVWKNTRGYIEEEFAAN